ncbi:agip47 [Agrotis ipsilon multiple nucleopolyhedrovirus]|uniref:Alkaline exonuclease n=1 Tax=Agrotis ipsilon multiple nucleopolyhedrovirus TaxID=208013 RepID=B6D5W1_9ABAC|nr:agip47 [Agrotis ipsilon multiple nucleopolyhedrovirus]ACI28749.1 alkaline exonuclease [Agrotis ipsilon multiple nucleopolyhedrovirus]
MVKRELTAAQQELFNKYSYTNYVNALSSTMFRLPIDEIMLVERATREQSNNPLWNMLRLDRQTASGSASAARSVPQSAAMSYGLCEEKLVKADRFLVDKIRDVIEKTIPCRVLDEILECGMFLSSLGLYSASPDAYFVAERLTDGDNGGDSILIPVEIKCPHTYRDTSVDEVRRGLGDRNARYRIKHTALSVNKRGSYLFAVEQTDAHYRQMQRQMYVLNAPLCVYVVRFANSYVVCTVRRDDTFFLKEQQAERKLFEMFVRKNQNRKRYKSREQRTKSLQDNNANITLEQAHALASTGLYYDFGVLQCIHCNKEFDADAPIQRIFERHEYCGDTSIQQMSALYNSDFVNHRKRVESLSAHRANVKFADQGVYHDGSGLKTFCCGVETGREVKTVKHNDSCRYNLMLTSQ